MLLSLLLACLQPVDEATGKAGGTVEEGDTAGLGDTGIDTGEPDGDTDSAEPDSADSADTADSADPVFEVDIDENVLWALAHRLAEVQCADGSYDWRWTDAAGSCESGYANVTGVTGLGMIAELDYRTEAEWQRSADATASYLSDQIDAILADPDDAGISCPNLTFLAQHLERNPDADLADRTGRALDAMLDSRHEAYGQEGDPRVVGTFTRLVQARSSIPGIIPWDAALCVEGVRTMAGRDPDFTDDADAAEAWLLAYSEDVFWPAFQADPTLDYGDISVANTAFVLQGVAGAEQLTEGLLDTLEAMVGSDGLISNSSENDGPAQASAYGLMALKAAERPSAQALQRALEDVPDNDGRVVDTDGYETFEVQGEMLRALALD